MTYWKRDAVKKLFSDLGAKIREEPAMGGYYDLTSMYLTPKGSREWVRVVPFVTHPEGTRGIDDACEVEHVEVRTDGDDGGGLQSNNMEVCNLYNVVCIRLRKKGFDVVPCMDNYF